MKDDCDVTPEYDQGSHISQVEVNNTSVGKDGLPSIVVGIIRKDGNEFLVEKTLVELNNSSVDQRDLSGGAVKIVSKVENESLQKKSQDKLYKSSEDEDGLPTGEVEMVKDAASEVLLEKEAEKSASTTKTTGMNESNKAAEGDVNEENFQALESMAEPWTTLEMETELKENSSTSATVVGKLESEAEEDDSNLSERNLSGDLSREQCLEKKNFNDTITSLNVTNAIRI